MLFTSDYIYYGLFYLLCATMLAPMTIIVHTHIKQMTQNTLNDASHPNIFWDSKYNSHAHTRIQA
jgi:hypothetical protein